MSTLSLLFSAIFVSLYLAFEMWSPIPDPQAPKLWDFAIGVASLPANAVIFCGAWNMRRAKRYRLSLTAAILACIPLLTPLVYLGIPFGIWALALLLRTNAKEAFQVHRLVEDGSATAPQS